MAGDNGDWLEALAVIAYSSVARVGSASMATGLAFLFGETKC